MRIKNKPTKKVLLIILALLPALLHLGGRDDCIYYFIPFFIDTTDGTILPSMLMFGYLFCTLIWCVYGYLFARWFGRLKKCFVICNLHVIINAPQK